jgi:Zn-dependent membrane protease YugP
MSKDRSVEWVEYTKVNAEVTKAKERVVTELRDKPGVYDVDLEGLKGSFTVER